MKKGCIIILFLLLLFTCSCAKNEGDGIVYATINGAAVTTDEIEYFKNRSRASIINSFAEKYDITDYSAFWTTEYDGITPERELERVSVDAALRAKIELTEMVKNGIYESTDFAYFQSLAQSYKGDENTVGLTSINQNSFYTYYILTGQMQLKNIFGMNDEEYEAYIDSLVSSSDIVTSNSR